MGQSTDWSRIDDFLLRYVVEPALAATVFASSFASALELVREGLAEIHRKRSFAPLYMRKRVGAIEMQRRMTRKKKQKGKLVHAGSGQEARGGAKQ